MPASPKLERLSEALHLTAHAWRIALDRRLRPLGLTRSKWMLLALLAHSDGLRQGELADRLGVEDPSVVHLVDRLEQEGLVKREADASDRRTRTVHLSAAGRAEVKRIRSVAAKLRATLLVDASEQEIEATLSLLDKIRSRLANSIE